jgi:hypothetical protein
MLTTVVLYQQTQVTATALRTVYDTEGFIMLIAS